MANALIVIYKTVPSVSIMMKTYVIYVEMDFLALMVNVSNAQFLIA